MDDAAPGIEGQHDSCPASAAGVGETSGLGQFNLDQAMRLLKLERREAELGRELDWSGRI